MGTIGNEGRGLCQRQGHVGGLADQDRPAFSLTNMASKLEPTDRLALWIATALMIPVLIYAYVDSTSRLAKVRRDTLDAWDLRIENSKKNMEMYSKYYDIALAEAKK